MNYFTLLNNRQKFFANIAVFAVYIIFAIPTMVLSERYHFQLPINAQSGIAFAALLLLGIEVFPSLFIGSTFIHIIYHLFFLHTSSSAAIMMSSTIGISSTLEVLIGFYLIKKLIKKEILFFSIQSIQHFIIAILVMSFIGSLTEITFQHLINPNIHFFIIDWFILWAADFIGIILFTSFFISLLPIYNEKFKLSQWVEFIFIQCVIIIIQLTLFGIMARYSIIAFLPFFTFPLLLWITYRFSLRAVLIALINSSVLIFSNTLYAQTLIPDNELKSFILLLQLFTAIAIITFLILHTVIHQMRKANKEMLRTHNELELLVFERTKELQLQLAEKIRSEEALKKSETQLRETNAMKDKFFAIIAHDLRNPFNSLLGFGELLVENLRNFRTEEIEGMLRNMNKSIRGVYTLLENLLNWSRIQTKNFKYNPQIFDLKIVVDENSDLLERYSKEKNITLINDINEYTLAYADPNMISTVIRNLIANAIKYSYPGGIITITVLENIPEYWEIHIKDEGVGMSSEIKNKIFKDELLNSEPGTMNEKGTGLGTKICKEFIEQCCGNIWVESEKGVGSVFKFTVPKKKK